MTNSDERTSSIPEAAVARLFVGAFTLLILLTGCSEGDAIREKAKTVRACVDAGGAWFNTPGWGESCHFDTRPTP